MRRIATLLASSLVVACAVEAPREARAPQQVLSLPQIAALSVTEAPRVFKQCSRPTPANIVSYWSPTADNMAELERALPVFLAREEVHLDLPLDQFHREYAGFVREGRRFIYGNFYASYFNDGRRPPPPTVICDGGRSVWGVVYDVEAGVFSELEFNGVA